MLSSKNGLRPPAGLTNPHFHAVLKRLKLILIGWDVRPYDTRSETGAVVERVQRRPVLRSTSSMSTTGDAPRRSSASVNRRPIIGAASSTVMSVAVIEAAGGAVRVVDRHYLGVFGKALVEGRDAVGAHHEPDGAPVKGDADLIAWVEREIFETRVDLRPVA